VRRSSNRHVSSPKSGVAGQHAGKMGQTAARTPLHTLCWPTACKCVHSASCGELSFHISRRLNLRGVFGTELRPAFMGQHGMSPDRQRGRPPNSQGKKLHADKSRLAPHTFSQVESERLIAGARGIKLAAISERAHVMHCRSPGAGCTAKAET
jgi:hypothetical protein